MSGVPKERKPCFAAAALAAADRDVWAVFDSHIIFTSFSTHKVLPGHAQQKKRFRQWMFAFRRLNGATRSDGTALIQSKPGGAERIG